MPYSITSFTARAIGVDTVRGGRARNADYRQREYLTEGEIDSLLATAGNSRNPVRDRLAFIPASRENNAPVTLPESANGILRVSLRCLNDQRITAGPVVAVAGEQPDAGAPSC
jgi:hypothetical protein